jgi:hypothetical protein
MLLQPLDRASIFKKVPEVYHPTLTKILDDMIQRQELIYVATSCSRTSHYKEYGKIKSSSYNCFIIVTEYRWIRAGWSLYDSISNGTTYYRDGSRFGALVDGTHFYEHKWVSLPKNLPSKRELGRRTLAEYVREYILEYTLKDFRDVRSRKNYTIVHGGVQLELMEIAFDEEIWYAFEKDQGELIYSLLQLAQQNDGHIPANNSRLTQQTQSSSEGTSLLIELERLARLYEAGHLTEEEFRVAKKKLL